MRERLKALSHGQVGGFVLTQECDQQSDCELTRS